MKTVRNYAGVDYTLNLNHNKGLINRKMKPTVIGKPHVTTRTHIASIYTILAVVTVTCTILVSTLTTYYTNLKQAETEVWSWSSQMAECLNGTWRGRTDSGAEIGCFRAESVEAHQKSSGSHK